MQQLKNFWRRLSPKTKKLMSMGLIAGAVFFVIYVFFTSTPNKPLSKKRQEVVSREIFTTPDSLDNFGVQGLAAEFRDMRKESEQLKREVDSLRKNVQSRESKPAQPAVSREEIEHQVTTGIAGVVQGLQSELDALRKELEEATAKPPVVIPPEPQGQVHSKRWTPSLDGGGDGHGSGVDWGMSPAPGPSSSFSPGENIKAADQLIAQGKDPVITPKPQAAKIRTLEDEAKKASADEAKQKEDPAEYIPAGSIFSGTLLTGMDAPTGDTARKSDPFPALLRVKHEAILPNRFRSDVRECFVVAGGWGDLSSERAYLRAERMSCVRNDGQVIEVNMDSYAVGEDGKAGVRGRLVSRNGQMLALSLLTGFMQGASEVFSASPVPTLVTTSQETTPFQQNLSSESLQTAGLNGTGKALDRLAEYYISMAESIFPVIEVDAGRKVDFVLVRGFSMKIK